jgi:hypothetical protein
MIDPRAHRIAPHQPSIEGFQEFEPCCRTTLNHFAYNFIKIHRTIRVSRAMVAGVTDRLWSMEDLVAPWEAYEQWRAA